MDTRNQENMVPQQNADQQQRLQFRRVRAINRERLPLGEHNVNINNNTNTPSSRSAIEKVAKILYSQ